MQSVVLNKMSQKTLSQDSNSDELSNEDLLNSYREAAMYDDYLFGDYDYYSEWVGISTN